MARHFGVFNENGNPQAFYADDVWKLEDMPATVVEVSEDQWQLLLARPDATFIDGEVRLPQEAPPA